MTRWLVTFALFSLLLPGTQAQEASAPPSQEEIVDSILELQRQIEELLSTLPPEVSAELRQRLAKPPEAGLSSAPAPLADASVAAPAVEPDESDVEPTAADPAPTVEPATTIAEAAPPTEARPAATTPVKPAPSDGIPKLIKRRSRRAPCNTLLALDENGDGKISSADRYWRHLYLWTDKNDDRQLQDREVESAYEHKVREIAVSLETFIRAKGSLGEIRVEDQIVFDLRGDGFSDRDRRDDGILVVDASALARGNGPQILGARAEPKSGFIAFRKGLSLDLSGEITELNCP